MNVLLSAQEAIFNDQSVVPVFSAMCGIRDTQFSITFLYIEFHEFHWHKLKQWHLHAYPLS